MEKTILMVLLSVLAALRTTVANGQSKKNRIAAMLTAERDSLEWALDAKNRAVVDLRVKLAQFDGVADTYKAEIKRLENRSDSLKDVLATRKAVIDSQATKITQLANDNAALQARQKELSDKNDDLNAQLAGLKQKPAVVPVTAKGAGPADTAKEGPKTGNVSPPNKPDTSKNRHDQQ